MAELNQEEVVKIAGKHLGKVGGEGYKDTYDPGLLVEIPRYLNREAYGIDDNNLPFVGGDAWNAYEVSALNKNGLPITAFAKITYPSSSKYIVESKSLKLYLNSFNMTYIDRDNKFAVYSILEKTITSDLCQLLESAVTVKLFDASAQDFNTFHHAITDVAQYITLENMVGVADDITCSKYTESPDLLEGVRVDDSIEQCFHSSVLKSNCRVTSQPDWGDVYIKYKGKYNIKPESLLQYVVSFRDECHFHEEICETIYKRLLDKFEPEELVVTCLYVRRGGIDINPIRSYKAGGIYDVFTNKNRLFVKTARQ